MGGFGGDLDVGWDDLDDMDIPAAAPGTSKSARKDDDMRNEHMFP